MYPLIEIKTVPIEIEMKTTHARMEHVKGTADMEITHGADGVSSIRSRAMRVNMDTFRSTGAKLPAMQRATGNDQNISYQTTNTYAKDGQIRVNARMSQAMTTNAVAAANVDATAVAQSAEGANAMQQAQSEWDQGELNIRYEMDKLNFDWRTGNAEFEFVPGDIEISVKQRPELIIKYIGGPLYVPPSADPDYEPLDVQA